MKKNGMKKNELMPITIDRKRSTRRQRGFTLIEMGVSTLIFGLLMLGVMGIFIMMLQMSANVNGAASSSIDASNVIQRITFDIREAQNFQLLDDVTHDSSIGSVTGIHLIFPSDYVPVTVSTTGSATATLSTTNNNPLYNQFNSSTGGNTLDFYRADYHQAGLVDGTPDPNNGAAIYMSGTENRNTLPNPMPIVTSVAPGPDSVQFIQPYSNPDGTGQIIANEVKIKLTCAYYDPVHGHTSSETTTGTVTSLTGECVFLRDHDPSGASSSGSHGRTQLP